jgi:lysozyme
MMKICNEAVDLIKHFEGLHDGNLSKIGLQPKMCPAGIWTVGYGHALRNHAGQWLKGVNNKEAAYNHALNNITEKEATALLHLDLCEYARHVDRLALVTLEDHEFGALVSLCYNIGVDAFKNSTALKKLNELDFTGCTDAMHWWNKVNGKVMKGLVYRRSAEVRLFIGDNWLV